MNDTLIILIKGIEIMNKTKKYASLFFLSVLALSITAPFTYPQESGQSRKGTGGSASRMKRSGVTNICS